MILITELRPRNISNLCLYVRVYVYGLDKMFSHRICLSYIENVLKKINFLYNVKLL